MADGEHVAAATSPGDTTWPALDTRDTAPTLLTFRDYHVFLLTAILGHYQNK